MRYETAIVTGASRGLGRAIARSLAARNLRLMLAARSEEELLSITEELASSNPGRIAYTVTDLRSLDSIRAMVQATRERFGPIDVLVNNAGLGRYKPLTEWSDEEIITTVNVNLTAVMLLTKAVLPDMIAARRGLVVQIGSDLGRRYLPQMAPYVASKFGVLGFGGSLLREVKDHGVKVSTVMPGIIDTSFNESQEGSREETWALKPEVLAEAVTALLDQPPHVISDEVTIHPLQQGDY